MTDVLNQFNKTMALTRTKLFPLAAIWMDKPIYIEGERTRRIYSSQKVRVENDALVNVVPDVLPATHVIAECRGTLDNSKFEIDLIDLNTHEALTIKF